MSRQSQNICLAFIQRRPNVFDVGPTLYKSYTNVLCLLRWNNNRRREWRPINSSLLCNHQVGGCVAHLLLTLRSFKDPWFF